MLPLFLFLPKYEMYIDSNMICWFIGRSYHILKINESHMNSFGTVICIRYQISDLQGGGVLDRIVTCNRTYCTDHSLSRKVSHVHVHTRFGVRRGR